MGVALLVLTVNGMKYYVLTPKNSNGFTREEFESQFSNGPWIKMKSANRVYSSNGTSKKDEPGRNKFLEKQDDVPTLTAIDIFNADGCTEFSSPNTKKSLKVAFQNVPGDNGKIEKMRLFTRTKTGEMYLRIIEKNMC